MSIGLMFDFSAGKHSKSDRGLSASLREEKIMSKSTLKILAAIIGGLAAVFVTQPVFGGFVGNEIAIIENSSTSLTATYNGNPLSVTFLSSDNWSFATPAGFLSLGQPQWTEPDNPNLVNYVDFTQNVIAFVHSDALPNSLFNSPVADGSSIQVGTIFGAPVFATFTDHAAASEGVPEAGATISLFGFTLLGLGLLSRKAPA
jgi:hypothetical protein